MLTNCVRTLASVRGARTVLSQAAGCGAAGWGAAGAVRMESSQAAAVAEEGEVSEPVVRGPWDDALPDVDFEFMRDILAAPSPVGLEAAMTEGVIAPALEEAVPSSWTFKRYKGSASLVVDTDAENKDDKLTVMVVGHADKIRMQVRSIGADGKVYINSDSHLPVTLLGNPVKLFSEDPEEPGKYRVLRGPTVEALGAIHFAAPAVRTGDKGVGSDDVYLELGVHGEKGKEQVEAMGIRVGDPILMDRPIQRAVAPNTFSGAYLDNGLGCFVTAQLAKAMAGSPALDSVRMLFTFAAFEEIGRFGSRVLASHEKPDVIVALDVNHDFEAAPGVGAKRYPGLSMGKGATLATGSVTSPALNSLITKAAAAYDPAPIPVQRDVTGVDTGTDAMAGVLGATDVAVTSVGFPIRSMHTISELGHTGDVVASMHLVKAAVEYMADHGVDASYFKTSHPRLDLAEELVMTVDAADAADAAQ